MPEQTYPRFKAWADLAGNVGIQCLRCLRTHWKGDEPATDPITGEPCGNCGLIKGTGVLESENSMHKNQCLAPDKRDDVVCSHLPSQPSQS